MNKNMWFYELLCWCPRFITPHHITPHHITTHHITPHHITPRHITPHHITPHHITPHHITPHHIVHPQVLDGALDALLELINSEDGAASLLEAEGAFDRLVGVLSNPEPRVRSKALQVHALIPHISLALQPPTHPPVFPQSPLLQSLPQSRPNLRQAFDCLVGVLSNPEPRARSKALQVHAAPFLYSLNPPSVFPNLARISACLRPGVFLAPGGEPRARSEAPQVPATLLRDTASPPFSPQSPLNLPSISPQSPLKSPLKSPP